MSWQHLHQPVWLERCNSLSLSQSGDLPPRVGVIWIGSYVIYNGIIERIFTIYKYE